MFLKPQFDSKITHVSGQDLLIATCCATDLIEGDSWFPATHFERLVRTIVVFRSELSQ